MTRPGKQRATIRVTESTALSKRFQGIGKRLIETAGILLTFVLIIRLIWRRLQWIVRVGDVWIVDWRGGTVLLCYGVPP